MVTGMEKQTKNRITRAWVGKELREQNRTELRTNAMLGALFALLFVPITVLISYCGVYRLIADLPVRVALTILSAVLFSSPVWLALTALGSALWERKQLCRGNFDILTAPVAYKTERMTRHDLREVLGFAGFREKRVTHTVYQLTEKGDDFYLVRYGKSHRIQLLYPAKLYEYRET